jgi:hypothetical protein
MKINVDIVNDVAYKHVKLVRNSLHRGLHKLTKSDKIYIFENIHNEI